MGHAGLAKIDLHRGSWKAEEHMKDDMAKPRRALPPADAPQAETQAAAEPTARGWAPASGRRFAAADEATKPPVNDEAPTPSTDGPVGRRHMATTDEPALTTRSRRRS